MHTIACEDGGKQEETVSAFLMLVLEKAQESGLFGIYGLLDQLLHIMMKTVRYSPLYKAETMIASLVMGCAHTKAINDTLGEELVAANNLGMLRFPDQLQINRYLTRFTAANVEELGKDAHNSSAFRVRGLGVRYMRPAGLGIYTSFVA